MEWEGGREGEDVIGPIRSHKSKPLQWGCLPSSDIGTYSFLPFFHEEAPRSIQKATLRSANPAEEREGGGRVSRPDTSLIGCLDWSRHKRSPLSIPLPLPLSPLRPFSFHRPSPRHHQAAPSCRCCSTSLFPFSRSPHNQSRPRPTFRPRKFVPKNIWRLILTLSLSLNLYPRCPLL